MTDKPGNKSPNEKTVLTKEKIDEIVKDLKKMEGRELPKGQEIDLNAENFTAWYIAYKT